MHLSHRIQLEICVEDVAGVRATARLGADRAELCDNLAAGGTTPSIGAVEAAVLAAREQVRARRDAVGRRWSQTEAAEPFGLQVMIRPRGGGFVYDSDEARAMVADVRRLRALATDMGALDHASRPDPSGRHLPPSVRLGFAVGALTREGTVDRGLTRLLIEAAAGAPVTFHRAVDETRDILEAYGHLARIGVDRVLTSGGAASAAEGTGVLATLVRAGGPSVIAAGGVRPAEFARLREATGVRELHLRCPAADVPAGEPHRTSEALLARAVAAVRDLRDQDSASGGALGTAV